MSLDHSQSYTCNLPQYLCGDARETINKLVNETGLLQCHRYNRSRASLSHHELIADKFLLLDEVHYRE
ncbi:hypothetical protein NPIL_101961, partial [Nephila pilipes]